MPSLEHVLISVALLLLLSVLASSASSRLGVPALALFLVLGMLAGSEGIGGIYFDDAELARSIGTVALALILFAGGLDTEWQVIRKVLWPGVVLATLGVLMTALVTAVGASYLLGVAFPVALLLGAIVSSTDAAAVFGVLRARSLKLRHDLTPLLEFESGVNDPMAVFLTLALTTYLTVPEMSGWQLLPTLMQQGLLGLVGGILCGYITLLLFDWVRLDYEGLYPALTIGAVLLTFSGTQMAGGSGFLAVYVAGLILGSRNFPHKISLIQFHDGLAWLMQIAMFLALGLLVFPSQLVPQMLPALGISLLLMVLARPISVLLSLAPFKQFDLRQQLFVSWVGLRGAVPVVLATIPLTEGIAEASLIFNVVFFIVLTSVVIQGTTIAPIGRRLGVIVDGGSNLVERRVASSLFETRIEEGSSLAGKRVVDLEIPRTALIVLLTREGESIIPRGTTELQVGDTLLVSARKQDLDALHQVFSFS